jgi:hypothetical protein
MVWLVNNRALRDQPVKLGEQVLLVQGWFRHAV